VYFGRNYAASRTANDDHWFVAQARLVAFFDRRVESVTIHMRNAERGEFWMRTNSQTAASRASPG
jgi:hypothetical protein